jgi:hypothetical protein
MKKEKLVPVFGTDFQARYAVFWYRFSRPDMLIFGTDSRSRYADGHSAVRAERKGRGVLDMCSLIDGTYEFSGAVPNRLTTLMHIHVGAFTVPYGRRDRSFKKLNRRRVNQHCSAKIRLAGALGSRGLHVAVVQHEFQWPPVEARVLVVYLAN